MNTATALDTFSRSPSRPQHRVRSVCMALAALAMSCASTVGSAQTIYRIMGPDGKVIFSDKPPAPTDQGKLVGPGAGARSDASGAGLPFELRQVVAKYPVILYTSAGCSPCESGRALLTSRGVPFTERTVSTNEDTDALKRLSGESSLPFLTIGGQKLKGMSDVEWTQYLDAAGYPKTSALPANYKNAAPTPLVSVQKVESAAPPKAAERAPVPEAPRPATPAVNPANPAGIQF